MRSWFGRESGERGIRSTSQCAPIASSIGIRPLPLPYRANDTKNVYGHTRHHPSLTVYGHTRHPSLTVYGHTGIQVPLTGFLRGELGCLHIGNRWCDTATAVAWYTASRCFSRAKSSGRAALRSWYLTKGGGVCVACECVRVSVSVRERESVSVIPTRKHHTHAAIRTRLQSHLFLSSPRKHHTTLLHAYNSGRFSPLFSFVSSASL